MTSTPEHQRGPQVSVADHQLRKTRLTARKCHDCVLRPGDLMRLGPARLAEIIGQAVDTGGFIVCHNSLPYGPHPDVAPAVCRGFYDAYDTQALQVAGRLWGFVEVDPPHPRPASDPDTDPGPPGAAPHPQGEQ